MTNSIGIKTTRIVFILVSLVNQESASIDFGFIKIPSDAVSVVNGSAYFNCSTSRRPIDSHSITWNHFPLVDGGQNSYIYDEGKIRSKYKNRFAIDIDLSSGKYNLFLLRLEIKDAGRFECIHTEDVNNKERGVSAELTVLMMDPACQSSIRLDEVIGPNVFGILPDEVQLTCNVTYHGNIPPQLEWKKFGQTDSTRDGAASHVVIDNRVIYTLKLKGDASLDNSSYACQTTTATQNQYKCHTETIKVLYFLGGNEKEQTVFIGDKITCVAHNSTMPCSSQWYHNNYTCPLSCDKTITAHLLGIYLCTVKCNIKGNDYFYETLKVTVVEPTKPPPLIESAADGNVGLIVVLSVGLIIATSILVSLGLLYFQRKRRANQRLLGMPIITNQDVADSSFDKFTVNQHFIDKGASGAIYGPFRWKDKKCALKQILYCPDKLTEEVKEKIIQQRDHCMKLDHPHLVKVLGVWFPLPALYILMEYAEGRSLDKILRPKSPSTPVQPFPLDAVKNWALQIADGMRYLHENNLVHRNLKAAHVLVMESSDVFPNTVKVGSYTLATDHDHWTVMSLKGTMAWMTPEYIDRNYFSFLSDVWSYGVTIWEILTREVPFRELKDAEVVTRAKNKTLRLEIPDSCPGPLRDLLTDCWNYEVDQRPSFEKICGRLQSLDLS